jgi:radical SAM superfamily enzyme YgiQ (UPF0313 family)
MISFMMEEDSFRVQKKVKTKAQFRVVMVCVHGTHWMASRYVHALLAKEGYDAHTVFFRETFEQVLKAKAKEISQVAEAIRDLTPDVVGFNVTSMGFRECEAIVARLKQHLPNVPIIFGGTHASLRYKECLENKQVDYLCRGEGDEAFPELLEALRTYQDPSKIPNIYVNQAEGYIENLPRPLVQGLDDLPQNDYTDDKKHYIIKGKVYHQTNPIPFQQHTYYINTARGCPFRCTFCGNSALANKELGKGRYLRRRSVESVIAELKQAMVDYPDLDFIYFWDDVFTAYPKWVLEFCEVYEREIGLPFFCYTHPEMITEKLMSAMVKAGLKKVTMGIESGSYRVRSKYMARFETDENIIKASKIQAGRGVDLSYDFILSAFETEEDKIQGLELCLQLAKTFKAQMHTMAYYPGYPITMSALSHGLIQPGDVVGAHGNQRRTQSMYAEDLKRNAYTNYYFLAGKKWLPNDLIRWMVKKDVHNKYPGLLVHGISAFRIPNKFISMARNYLHFLSYGHWRYLLILIKSYRSFIELHIGHIDKQETYECTEIHDRLGAPV